MFIVVYSCDDKLLGPHARIALTLANRIAKRFISSSACVCPYFYIKIIIIINVKKKKILFSRYSGNVKSTLYIVKDI